MLTTVLILPLALSLPAFQDIKDPALQVTEEYNRIKDRTTLNADLSTIVNKTKADLELSLIRAYVGQGRGGRSSVIKLYFLGQSYDSWQYLKYHSLTLLVDGERFRFEPDHDGDVQTGYALEHMFVDVDDSKFRKLANARSIEGQIGSDEFSLTARQRDILKEFARYDANPALIVKTPEMIRAEQAEARARAATEKRQADEAALKARRAAQNKEYEEYKAKSEARKRDFYKLPPAERKAMLDTANRELRKGRNLEADNHPLSARMVYEGVLYDLPPSVPQFKTAQARIKAINAALSK